MFWTLDGLDPRWIGPYRTLDGLDPRWIACLSRIYPAIVVLRCGLRPALAHQRRKADRINLRGMTNE